MLFCLSTFPFQYFSSWLTYIKQWCCFGFISIPFGLPQIYPFLNRLSDRKGQFLTFILIYKKFLQTNDPFDFFKMWWRALGLYGLISLCFGLFILNINQLKVYGISLLIWGITNMVLYQPWSINNIKILYNAWVPLSTAVVSMYYITLLRHYQTFLLGILMIFITILSSASYTPHTNI